MERLLRASELVLEHREVEAETQQIIDRGVAALRDFDLARFYRLLPEVSEGVHELPLRAGIEGNVFRVRRARPGEAFQVSLKGPRNSLGDVSQLVRARLPADGADEQGYRLSVDLGIGIGDVDFRDMRSGLSTFLSQAFAQEARRTGPASDALEALHPALEAEDVAVMEPLFHAYPELSRMLSQMGRIDDVRVADAGSQIQHLRLALRGVTERFGKSHPEFAKYMRRLGRVGRMSFSWVDEHGRNLMKAQIDSATLAIDVECFLKDGALLPWSGTKVDETDPLHLSRSTPLTSRVIVDGTIELMGLMMSFTGFQIDLGFVPHEAHAEFRMRATRMPKTLDVQGAAFGFMPLGLVNAFIPGDVRSITLDFFRVALEGNQGRGVVIDTTIGSRELGGNGVIEVHTELEAPDNRLVKMAMATVNHKLVAIPKVQDDMRAFIADLQRGLQRDLSAYQGLAAAGDPSATARSTR